MIQKAIRTLNVYELTTELQITCNDIEDLKISSNQPDVIDAYKTQ